MRTRLLSVSLLAALLTVSACTSKPAASPPPLDGVPQASQSAAVVAEGPADQPSQLPRPEVVLRLVKAEKMPRQYTAEMPAENTAVRVTYTLANGSDKPIKFDEFRTTNLWYGANRFDAETVGGYAGTAGDRALSPKQPTQVAARGEATLVDSFQVPTAELGVLAFHVRVPGFDPALLWTFTGMEKMLR